MGNRATASARSRLASVAIALVAAVLSAPDAGAQEAPVVAPDCGLALPGDAQPAALSRLRGEVLYVDFWASWCGPCADAFPFMNDLVRDFGGRGLRVIGINVDEDADDALAFLAQHPAQFTVALAAGASCARAFGVRGMPAAFVVDRAGSVRASRYGFRAGEARQTRALLEGLLAEPAAQAKE